MNYRHAYHAGNFADVMKHSLMVLALAHLGEKAKPFFFLDTHAGTGLTDLSGKEAQATGEFRSGIARLLEAPPASLPPGLELYCELVRKAGAPDAYPGSPWLARHLAHERTGDRFVFCEAHPDDATILARLFDGDPQATTRDGDGHAALAELLPPAERRGLVLIDPPFEDRKEWETLANALRGALKRWGSGSYLLWYPIKDPSVSGAFLEHLESFVPAETLRLELRLRPADGQRMTGSGLVAVNPPYRLVIEGPQVLESLAHVLGAAGANWVCEPLGV